MSAHPTHSTAVLSIATPEGVTFSLPLAGPITRALGYLVDLATVMALVSLLRFVILFASAVSPDLGGAASVLMNFIFMFGYATVAELLFNGQTLGKRVMGIRVMDERGLRLRPGQVLIRNLVRVLDFLPFGYGIGGIFCLFSSRCQRLGDLAAGTIVVREVKLQVPNVDDVLGGKYNSFRAHPHLEARLRQKLSPQEAQVALSALLRVGELDPGARVSLFAAMAERIKALVVFPEEVVFGMTDEQYVRNAVDSIYRKAK